MITNLRSYIEADQRTADDHRPKVFGRSDWPLKRWFVLLKIDVNADVPSGAPSWLTRSQFAEARARVSLIFDCLVSEEDTAKLIRAHIRERNLAIEKIFAEL